ncbi:PHD-type domain-containing protein [Phanerochaete sordida]|uniref:PHD-type domain-containing protein n=1 Tax=Phanerochaete sordida TaxID=48140 RepID=A0A9P3L9K4_9APHY|nr:PHD-type domain-containing protein [Phanerochaete sordida]
MVGVHALPAPQPVSDDAMQVQLAGLREPEPVEVAPTAPTTSLGLPSAAEALYSPAQPRSARPPSPAPIPATAHGPPFPDDSLRHTSSVHLDSLPLKTEALDSPVVPSISLPGEKQAHDTKPKVKKGKLDGVDAGKSKERPKPKPKPKHSVKPVDSIRGDKKGDKKDDTDDWFLEQFGETESSKALPVAKSATLASHRARTPDGDATHHRQKPPGSSEEQRHASSSRRLSVGRSRSPTPLEMLEAELEDVPLVTKRSPEPLESSITRLLPASPATQTQATTTDLDLDTELERTLQDDARASPPPVKPKPKPRPRPKPKREVQEKVDMDVEDELLALLDDGEDERRGKHGSDHSHSPSIGSSLSREVPKHAVKGAGHSALVASSTSELNTPMPPPGSRAVSQLRESSMVRKGKDESDPSTSVPAATSVTPSVTPGPTSVLGTSGSSKVKEASKKKAQAKSRAKTGSTNKTKARPSLVKERSATPAASPHPTPNLSDAPTAAGKSKKAQGSLTAKRAVSAAAGASRSRSTSVMPGEGEASARKRSGQQMPDEKEEKVEDEQEVDDRLYCICRTPYDEDRVMIACDRCDEWYHTQCVKMPDLEVDLVDQFICPICVANNPHLPLRTTYKKRCLAGLAHARPASQHACHKPARGAFSKYCSDECGVRYMRERIERFARDSARNVAKASKEIKEEESMRGLWEGVKSAGQREAVVLRMLDGLDDKGEPLTEIVVPRVPKHVRLIARLEVQLNKISSRRDELKTDDEIVVWREAVLGYAAQRAERHGECGWDGRLLWSSDEVREYGADVLDAYERIEMRGGDEMSIDDQVDDGGWWCTGKRKCDRHAGWQKLRQAEMDLEKELYEAELERLTTREREIRKRIEDIQSAHPDTAANSHRPDTALDSHAARSDTNHSLNGVQGGTLGHSGDVDGLPKLNGVNGIEYTEKKGKKRKVDAR